ncbi:hypothetical protein TNCV_1734461 [Trichonephila clavipes]|nr:hypothetical protein TNCV_1734461 [Trichonephila clavipes]
MEKRIKEKPESLYIELLHFPASRDHRCFTGGDLVLPVGFQLSNSSNDAKDWFEGKIWIACSGDNSLIQELQLASLLGFGWKRVAINPGPKEPKGHVNEKTRHNST